MGTHISNRRVSIPRSTGVSFKEPGTARASYCLRTSLQDRTTVEILIIFYSVAVLNYTFCAAIGWWCAINLPSAL